MSSMNPLRDSRAMLLLVAMGASLWAIALCLAVWPDVVRTSPAGAVLATLTRVVGSLICHQLPERSFHVAGAVVPVCARCTGLYAGAVPAAWLAWWRWRHRPSHQGDVGFGRVMVLVGIAVNLLTVIAEWVAGSVPSNHVRAVSGAMLGASVLWLIAAFATAAPSPLEVN